MTPPLAVWLPERVCTLRYTAIPPGRYFKFFFGHFLSLLAEKRHLFSSAQRARIKALCRMSSTSSGQAVAVSERIFEDEDYKG